MKAPMQALRTEFMNLVGTISVVELITNEKATQLIQEIYEDLNSLKEE